MKKIPLILIFFLFLLNSFSPIAYPKSEVITTYPINGLSISDIGPDTFLSKSPQLPVGLIKVEDPSYYIDRLVYAHSHSISIYYKINLFEYAFQAPKITSYEDLINLYKNTSFEDFYSKERLLSVINACASENGKYLSYITKAEPEIEVTYKYVSSKKGYSLIPQRKVIFKDEIVTHFLLDPLLPITGERISPYDFTKAFEIETALYNTKVARVKERNKLLDLDGFYVELPLVIPSESYKEKVEKSLSKLKNYLHSIDKKLLVGNITKETLKFAKYADIVGIVYNGDTDFLKSLRESFSAPVILTYNGKLNSQEDLESYLGICLTFGLTPEFRRNEETGEFFYYEDFLNKNSEIVNKYLSKITLANLLGIKEIEKGNNNYLVKFGDFPSEILCFLGTGEFSVNYSEEDIKSAEFIDINNEKISIENLNKINNINGFYFLQSIPKTGSLIYACGSNGLLEAPASNNKYSLPILNYSFDRVLLNITESRKNLADKYAVEFHPFEYKSISFEKELERVSVNGNSFSPEKAEKTNFLNIVFFIAIIFALIGMSFLAKFLNKKTRKVTDVNVFFLFIPITIILQLINHLFLHYSPITLNFLIFSLFFFIYSIFSLNYKKALTSFIMLFLLAMLYNFFEFGTVLPVQFASYPPFNHYEIFFFYFPYFLTVLHFSTEPPNNISKSEIISIFGCLLAIAIASSLSLPFSYYVQLQAFYPLIILSLLFLLSRMFSLRRNKKEIYRNIVFCAIICLLIMVSTFLCKYYVENNPKSYWAAILTSDFSILIAPLFFIWASSNYSKVRNPSESLNLPTYVLIIILTLYFSLSQMSQKVFGSPYFSMFGSYVTPIILVLFSLFFIENIYKTD